MAEKGGTEENKNEINKYRRFPSVKKYYSPPMKFYYSYKILIIILIVVLFSLFLSIFLPLYRDNNFDINDFTINGKQLANKLIDTNDDGIADRFETYNMGETVYIFDIISGIEEFVENRPMSVSFAEHISLRSLDRNELIFVYYFSGTVRDYFEFDIEDQIVLEVKISSPEQDAYGLTIEADNVFTFNEFREKMSYKWELYFFSFLFLIVGILSMHIWIAKKGQNIFPKRMRGVCNFCGNKMNFINYYNKWYCQNCKRYN